MRIRAYAIGAMLITVTLAAGCSSDDNKTSGASATASATAPAATAAPATSSPASRTTAGTTSKPGALAVGTSPWGPILTDQEGRTLYGFTSDTNGTSTCVDTCATKWPPLTVSSPTAGAGVAADKVGSTTRPDGTTQVVYGKWPLYYFANDVKPGDMKGQGVGGKWYVVAPDGKLIKMAG